ncbi:R (restriction) subunit and related helicases ... (PDB:2W00) [Commensalibacter communis]|nr:R (restriction) subunit and related helicases ... (PDB:2W00) [Commensalibacter communis]
MRKAFDSQVYQVMIVANKFQTGFDQPKLVAMYVDKKLKGVECIQTLSRLNRTCNEKGKDTTFVLDFINNPRDVLDEFKVYYQTAELMDVSDPNIIYTLMESITDAGIFYWEEVERFVEAFYNKKTNQAQSINICKPAIDRFKQKYGEAAHSIEETQGNLKHITRDSDQINTQRYEIQLSKVKERKDRLDI